MPPRRKTETSTGPAVGAGSESAKARTDGVKASAVELAKRWRRVNMASPRLERGRHGAVGQHAPCKRQCILARVERLAGLQPQAVDDGDRDLGRCLDAQKLAVGGA